jgi:16S rRNA C1402 (ribose-2'-O) methylase RsmI
MNGCSNRKRNPAEAFKQKIKEGKSIGIISEAGCPEWLTRVSN